MKKNLYSIVIPVYNEEENIPVLYNRLRKVMQELEGDYEIIFVDDGSSDSSWLLICELHEKDNSVKGIKLSRNFGHQIAITSGIESAIGDVVITMDADLQDPPEIIPELVKKWRCGYEVVYAIREKRRGENFLKRGFAWLFYRVLKKITKIDIPPDVGDFRLLSRKAVEQLKRLIEQYRFVRGLSTWIGFKQTGVEFVREARYKGKPKYSFWKSLKLALNGIVSFSIAPLQLASYMGFVVSILSFLYAIWSIIAKFVFERTIPGWTSIIVVVLFLGGVQLITLGIIGEYIGRIYGEVKKRPLYIIEQKVGYKDNEEYKEENRGKE
jgi:dolichol-phosphate mannosyltransferase